MSTFLSGKNATGTLAGVASSIIDGSIDEEITDDEMTNLTSGGFYEEVMCIKKCTLSGVQVAYQSATPPTWGVGSTIPVNITIPSGSTFSCATFNIKKVSRKYISPKGGYKFTFDGVTTGPYTMTF